LPVLFAAAALDDGVPADFAEFADAVLDGAVAATLPGAPWVPPAVLLDATPAGLPFMVESAAAAAARLADGCV
jgi:hypothetical protein